LKQDVQVSTYPGKKSRDICTPLRHINMSECENVIIYAGGNDVAAGNSMTSIKKEFRETVEHLDNGRRRIFICTLSPRIDINVNPLNSVIRRLCGDTHARLIDVNHAFQRNDGTPLFHLYHRDGIHLNAAGGSTLVKTIDREVCIIRDGPSQNRRPGFNQSYRKSHTPHIRGNSRYHQNTMNTRDSWNYQRSSQRHPMLDNYGAEAVR